MRIYCNSTTYHQASQEPPKDCEASADARGCQDGPMDTNLPPNQLTLVLPQGWEMWTAPNEPAQFMCPIHAQVRKLLLEEKSTKNVDVDLEALRDKLMAY